MGYSQEFIEKHRDFNVNHEWWDSVCDDFNRICEILGIELDKHEPSFSGFWSQGDGASWAGKYRAKTILSYTHMGSVPTYDLAPQQIREHAPKDETLHKIADELCLLARIYRPVYVVVGRHGHNYVHSATMCVSEWEYFDDYTDDVDEAIADHIETTLLTQFRALANWLYATLEVEYEYLTSDEAVIESLEANEIAE